MKNGAKTTTYISMWENWGTKPFCSQPYTVYRWKSRAEKHFGDLTVYVYR